MRGDYDTLRRHFRTWVNEDIWSLDDEDSLCFKDETPPSIETVCSAWFLYWLRHIKKSKEWVMKYHCTPSPKGYKTKRGYWVPAPEEACLCRVKICAYSENSGKNDYRPFAWWDHCKTYQHCLFIARHRRGFFREHVPTDSLCSVSSALSMECVPQLINSNDPLEKMFFSDWAQGLVPEIPEEYANIIKNGALT